MKSFTFLLWLVSLVSLASCITTAAAPASSGTSADPAKHWTADNGNGTYSNPLFYEEFEDPDVIRVGDTYYLAGTTMHMNPAVQLMQSKDLVNWELAGYCTDKLDLGPAFRLEDGRGNYGRGIWAPCLRYHNGMFYVFSNVNGVGLQVFRSKSIKGPWERNQLPGRHDLSVLFDDDGKIYIISGNRSPYPIEEIAPDLKSFVPGVRHELDARMGEGHHLYKINGKYYDVSAIPGATTDQMVARADSIDGPWTVERMVRGESLGITTVAIDRATVRDRGLTLHQGGMCDTPSGEWWSIIMSAWSLSPGTTVSRSSACRAISVKHLIHGLSPTPVILKIPNRHSFTTTTSTAASSIPNGSGTMSPMTVSGLSPRNPGCFACIPCRLKTSMPPATASVSGRRHPSPS